MKYLAVLIVIVASLVMANETSAKSSNVSWASWYGPGLYGNRMGCGGVLTTSTWGVAHKSLPCGTRLTICYRKCVRVSVVDRGPYVAGREFDLTYLVKSAIGMPSTGKVRWWKS